jgi:hypothetical protein
MLPKTPRALSAVFVFTTSLALGACATAPADFEEDGNAAEDDGSSSSAGGASSSSNGPSTSSTGGNTSSSSSTGGTTGQGGDPGTGGMGTGGGMMSTSGETCMDAADLTSAAANLTGTFTDSMMDAGSCDPTADNIAWFEYTAPATGLYDFVFNNNSTTPAFSRLAVFEGTSCSPLGAEVACEAAAGQTVDSVIQLEQGVTYTIMFYTDGPAYPMENPTATISTSTAGPGSVCPMADDLTSATMPYTLNGTFDEDPLSIGSCASQPTNVAWFKYTAPTSDTYLIEADNQSTTGPWSRLVVLEGDSCSPLGTEVLCDTNTSSSIEGEVDMTAGQTYIIAFHTDGDTYTMVNPVMNVGVKPPPPPGGDCDSAVDASSQTFPFQQVGLFEDDPSNVSPSCDSTPTNAVWFTYTPSATDWYDLTLVNNTTDNSYSRVAVFEGDTCPPAGAELYCGTSSSTTHSTSSSIQMQAGTTYQILFYTDGDTYEMEDPELTVAVGAPPPPGDSCDAPIDLSSASLPFTQVGSYQQDPSFGGTCDSDATNVAWFSYTPTTSGYYDVSGTNGSATVSDTRVVVVEGSSCATAGLQVGCMVGSGATATETSYLEAGQSYLIAVFSAGNSSPMDDPSVNIQAAAAPASGLMCPVADDISGATFPYALTGDFTDDDYAGSTCDSTPNNVVWYRFTPTTTQAYDISAVNNTSSSSYSRLAVFESASCSPFGNEVDCTTNASTSVALNAVTLTAGVEYLIAFYTDGESWPMEDPSITISP